MAEKLLCPSMMCANYGHLADEVRALDNAGVDIFHCDIMDGQFVPNFTMGVMDVQTVRKYTDKLVDCHLMIENPDSYLGDFVTEKTEYITVHQEACKHLHRTIQHIRSYGVGAGVSLNPATPVSSLENILEDVDLVLIMSVNPGFGGQSLIPSTLRKIRKLAEIREKNDLKFRIEIDGGVNLKTIRDVAETGVDIIVAGSAVFGAEDLEKRVAELKEYCR